MPDEVRTEVIGNALGSLTEEMGVAVARASFSTMIQESAESSAALLDAAGRLVSTGHDTTPLHGSSLRYGLRSVIADFPLDTMADGDVFVLNDPFRGGIHSNDLLVLKPVFLTGDGPGYFTGTLVHVADLGGASSGGLLARARDAWLTLEIGLASMTASMILMAFFHVHTWQVVLWPVLFGLGMSWSVLGSAKLILEAVPHGDTAVSTGVMGVGRSIGSGAAVPVLGAILAHHVHHVDPASGQVTYTDGGFTVTYLVAGACALAATILVAAMRHTGRAARAVPVAAAEG